MSEDLRAEIEELRTRIVELEARLEAMPTALRFRGPYRDGEEYRKGDLVVFNGSLWYCGKATAAWPTDSQSGAWTLCAKCGRDGRDADVRPLARRVAVLEAMTAKPSRSA
jgi:hypothetical protein